MIAGEQLQAILPRNWKANILEMQVHLNHGSWIWKIDFALSHEQRIAFFIGINNLKLDLDLPATIRENSVHCHYRMNGWKLSSEKHRKAAQDCPFSSARITPNRIAYDHCQGVGRRNSCLLARLLFGHDWR